MSASLPTSQLLDLDAVALAGALRSEKVSCVELMSATLDRIEALNPRFNAIVALRDRETLIAEARVRDTQPARGPLHMGSFGSREILFLHVSNSEGSFGIRGPSPIA